MKIMNLFDVTSRDEKNWCDFIFANSKTRFATNTVDSWLFEPPRGIEI